MKRILSAAAIALALTGPAQAQSILAEYFTLLSPNDMFNSRGVRLTDMAAVLQQDRANYHRFGLRDGADSGDPYFADPANRAQIPGLYATGPGASPRIVENIRAGRGNFVLVRIVGYNGVPAWIEVVEGAG